MISVRGIASNLACNLLTLSFCQDDPTRKRNRDGSVRSEFCGGKKNPDGSLKHKKGPVKSKEEVDAGIRASAAKRKAKKDALKLAFVTHRDALEKCGKWTGPRKFQDFLDEQGWAALKASSPAAAPASAASVAAEPSAAEQDDAARKRANGRIHCNPLPPLCLSLCPSNKTQRAVLHSVVLWCCLCEGVVGVGRAIAESRAALVLVQQSVINLSRQQSLSNVKCLPPP